MNQQKKPLNITEKRKEYVESLIARAFELSTNEKYVHGREIKKVYEKLDEEYGVFLLTFNNYNKLKLVPSICMREGEQNLSKDEHAYLAHVVSVGCTQMMAYFNHKHGYAPCMFLLYYIFWVHYQTDNTDNITKQVFKENDVMFNIANKAINLYTSLKDEILKELKTEQSSKIEKEFKIDEIFPTPYIYFVYPNLYSKLLKNFEDGLWENQQTSLLETSKYRLYLAEMKQLYIEAYQFQQKQNQQLQEYIKKNQLSKEELEAIDKREREKASRIQE